MQCWGRWSLVSVCQRWSRKHIYARGTKLVSLAWSPPLLLLSFYLYLHFIGYRFSHFPLGLLKTALPDTARVVLYHLSTQPSWPAIGHLAVSMATRSCSSVVEVSGKISDNGRTAFPIRRRDSSCLFAFSLLSSPTRKVSKPFPSKIYSYFPESFSIKSDCVMRVGVCEASILTENDPISNPIYSWNMEVMSAAQTGDAAIKITSKKWLRRKLEVPGSQTCGEQTHHVGSALPTAGLSRKAERVLLANLRNSESHPKHV